MPKLDLMVEAPPWVLFNPGFSQIEQSMLDYRGCFITSAMPKREHLLTNCSYQFLGVKMPTPEEY